jgi:hypothetical protein
MVLTNRYRVNRNLDREFNAASVTSGQCTGRQYARVDLVTCRRRELFQQPVREGEGGQVVRLLAAARGELYLSAQTASHDVALVRQFN